MIVPEYASTAPLGSSSYPRHYLYIGCLTPEQGPAPSDQIRAGRPFQWSCHIEVAPGHYDHVSYIDTLGDGTGRTLATHLVNQIAPKGALIVQQDQTRRVLGWLQQSIPELGQPLAKLMSQLIEIDPTGQSIADLSPRNLAQDQRNLYALLGLEDGLDPHLILPDEAAAAAAYREFLAGHGGKIRKTALVKSLLHFADRQALALALAEQAEPRHGQGVATTNRRLH
ncbi:MAG: DUF2779 domain-containing protein [Sphingobacteriia bacterium]|nr:DUF2779 domain-containing protein [Sphingobacteriia bacterium]NCC39692.1 DUF2779 domain-containing protein [Gammaproteobacteria bacterium]